MSPEMKRAIQHSENIKWQQDSFHRILYILCLSKEGLASQQQLESCKRQVLAFLESMHPEGEWPEFTRDKLLFLQDLLYSSCISEAEYHASKKPLIRRLADQGAILDAEDFIFDSSLEKDTKLTRSKSGVRTVSSRKIKDHCIVRSDTMRTQLCQTDSGDASSKPSTPSPLKQVMGAVCRFNKNPSSRSINASPKTDKESSSSRVPCAPDFPKPEHGPAREPPSPLHVNQQKVPELPVSSQSEEEIGPALVVASSVDDVKDGDICNLQSSPMTIHTYDRMADEGDPLLGRASPVPSNNKSPAGGTPSRLRNVFKGLISKKVIWVNADTEKNCKTPDSAKKLSIDGQEEKDSPATKGRMWGFEKLRVPRKLQFEQDENSHSIVSQVETGTLSDIPLGKPQANEESAELLGSAVTKKKLRKLPSPCKPSDFIIDKVLGENIKNELSRIRAEMNKEQPGQIFSNEQIDAIATKLPMDKVELRKFFPLTWCERYGDIVLDVVQKEFKEHVNEMQKLARRRDNVQQGADAFPLSYNDENSGATLASAPSEQRQVKQSLPRRNADLGKCFATLNENSPVANAIASNSPRSDKKFVPQQQHSLRPIKENHRRDEDILKMPLREVNEYGSHSRPWH
ncbi:hypothetical protein KP509_21G048200 [Ceratopteris richardii]|nr:hypothetical protein KP509_21G048200 [Ceratopteris richardii]